MTKPRVRRVAAVALTAMLISQGGIPLSAAAQHKRNGHDAFRARDSTDVDTETPIKHVIVLIGENRTFDHVYGTYVPQDGQSVSNLLSKGIVNADGSPGPNADDAKQFQLGTITPPAYFISTDTLIDPHKTAYEPFLPTPEAGGAPAEPVTLQQLHEDPAPAAPPLDPHTLSLTQLATLTQGLEQGDLDLLTTGVTGLNNCTADPPEPPSACAEPDTRVANFASLPNTVFELSGPHLPYDSYTGDMVHRFFHMWQQSDCDVVAATPDNPTGCRNDLYPYVGIARGDDSGSNSMGFCNVQKGQARLFTQLANEHTLSDNFHQSVMGGTAVQHIMLGTGDAIFWEQVGTFPAQPPANRVADPTPKSTTNDAYVRDQRWTKCGDPTQPGIKPIMDYLKPLPWRPDRTASHCAAGRFYMINNTHPGFRANGDIDTAGIMDGSSVPPSSLRTIGDALNDKHISWAFYGGGYNAAVRFANGSTDPFDVLIGTGGDWYCDICNPFQYAASIMGDAAQRQKHIKDV